LFGDDPKQEKLFPFLAVQDPYSVPWRMKVKPLLLNNIVLQWKAGNVTKYWSWGHLQSSHLGLWARAVSRCHLLDLKIPVSSLPFYLCELSTLLLRQYFTHI